MTAVRVWAVAGLLLAGGLLLGGCGASAEMTVEPQGYREPAEMTTTLAYADQTDGYWSLVCRGREDGLLAEILDDGAGARKGGGSVYHVHIITPRRGGWSDVTLVIDGVPGGVYSARVAVEVRSVTEDIVQVSLAGTLESQAARRRHQARVQVAGKFLIDPPEHRSMTRDMEAARARLMDPSWEGNFDGPAWD